MAIDVTNAAPAVNPVWVDVPLATVSSGSVSGQVQATDGDGDTDLTYSIPDGKEPEHGTLNLDSATGEFTYEFDGDFDGLEMAQVVVSDGVTTSQPVSVIIQCTDGPIHLHGPMQMDVGLGPTVDWYAAEFGATLRITGLPHAGALVKQIYNPVDGSTSTTNYSAGDVLERATQSLYVPDNPSNPVADTFEFSLEIGPLTTTDNVFEIYVGSAEAWTGNVYYNGSSGPYAVSADSPTTLQSGLMSLSNGIPYLGTIEVTSDPQHGSIDLAADGTLTFTPDDPESGEEPYVGWDEFTITATDPNGGGTHDRRIQLNVGFHEAPGALPGPSVPMFINADGSIEGTVDGLTAGIATARDMIGQLYEGLAQLGRGVGDVANASDDQILQKLGSATGPIDALATQYDEYLKQVVKLNRAAGKFLAARYWPSEADGELIRQVAALPDKVGSLSASHAQAEELAKAAAELGEGASIAVDTASRTVQWAEGTHKVLTAVQMVGGVGPLVQTGVSILTQKTFTLCAKRAAVVALQWGASAVAAAAANYAIDQLHLSEEQAYWLRIGLDAYQIFAFFKAAKSKVNSGSSCFAAGTQVIVGQNADGSYITRAIEEIHAGDTVLSRDQSSAIDTIEPHRVESVFSKTADHIRVIEYADTSGHTERIETTDNHPFWVEGTGWVEAGKLTVGAELDAPDGSARTVTTSTRIEHLEGVTVYNMTVSEDHTYFVADSQTSFTNPVWVHNAECNPTVNMTPSQLQKNFGKHGADFGLTGTWNPARAEDMRQAILAHINKPGNITIMGGYHGKSGFIHILDKQSGVNVVINHDGYFVAGFKLSASQLSDLWTTGHFF
ncbi:MAG: polymorphic toxin-type HINT domain-containing protein [Tepidisphaeraceae bacterium]